MESSSITLNPIGFARSEIKESITMPLKGIAAQIEVLPQYADGLHRIEENSHLWVLSWFHQAIRDTMRVIPKKVNPQSDEFGVFAIRSPIRPNPIALTLVTLEKVEGNILSITGYDGIDGTPILDIKPYFEKDIVMSPRTPVISKP